MVVALPKDERLGVGVRRGGGIRRRGQSDRGGLLSLGRKVILIDINLLFIRRVNTNEKKDESCGL